LVFFFHVFILHTIRTLRDSLKQKLMHGHQSCRIAEAAQFSSIRLLPPQETSLLAEFQPKAWEVLKNRQLQSY